MAKACLTLKNAHINVSLHAPTVSAITPASGAHTAAHAITNLAGTNFRPGATVTVGGLAVTGVTVVSRTKITASPGIPIIAAGAKDVVVTNPDGRQNSGASGAGLYTST